MFPKIEIQSNSQNFSVPKCHLLGYFHNLWFRQRGVEVAVDIVVHQLTVQVHGGRGGLVGVAGGLVAPVQTAQLQNDQQQEAGDPEADTESDHQHQLPLVGLSKHSITIL